MSFKNLRIGYLIVVGIMVFIGVILFYICFRNIREYVKVNRLGKFEKVIVKDYVRVVFINRLLLCLIFMIVFIILVMNINN